MILSDREIIEYLDSSKLIVKPITIDQIQPASIDIRLGNTFCFLDSERSKLIELGSKVEYKSVIALYPPETYDS